ncbi:MAG: sugar phosphate isomerase/epimerase [Oscillospiraceae bacterium]|jgi:sugar phosphate isomerase/epimerase|nr:sugar phosphate isomerase/epimerase [Oscillospiraceae bacterium]
MHLGIISGASEAEFAKVRQYGLHYAEFCVNVGCDVREYTDHLEEIQGYQQAYDVQVASIGRWGTKRLADDGSFDQPEYEADLALIDFAAALGCPVFVCGCNEVKGMSFIQNALRAADYFRSLTDHAAGKGVKIAVYNCDWGNAIYNKAGWDAVLPLVPGLGIKYDTSHCINRDGDYLQEMLEYGKYIYHFHIKGTVRIHGRNISDPPAGFDDIAWGAVMAILYDNDYQGVCSIEPHSSAWTKGTRGDFGVRFTKAYFEKYILEEDGDDGDKQYMPGD